MRTIDGFHNDEREYYFGLKRSDGSPKLLSRLWSNGGMKDVREIAGYFQGCPHEDNGEKKVLITGGAGFVGTNLADHLLKSRRSVIIYDNLSRPGVERNLRWLRETHSERLDTVIADVRDPHTLRECVQQSNQVYHLAAQVAVTSSLSNPALDFEVNAAGTLNLLEAIRSCDEPPGLVFTSTNKVYGALESIDLIKNRTRYEPQDIRIRTTGIGENCSLGFHSPYGCSKGAADQYVIDYSRSFGLKTVVLRMSCIYGPHQMGNEDQGWVAHFLICTINDEPVTIYGDGLQVRDVLYVQDLVDALVIAQAEIASLSGRAFNIGGGPDNTTSLLEIVDLIEDLHGSKPQIHYDDWRIGDQRYYVSDTSAFRQVTGWTPRTPLREGLRYLYEWLQKSTKMVGSQFSGLERRKQCRLSNIEPTLERPRTRR